MYEMILIIGLILPLVSSEELLAFGCPSNPLNKEVIVEASTLEWDHIDCRLGLLSRKLTSNL